MTMTKPTSEQVTFTAAGSGATLRNLVDKVREVVSVKDFGAIGDGVANDAAAVEAAITSALASSRVVYFPYGQYRMATAKTFQYAGDLFMYGDNATLILAAGTPVCMNFIAPLVATTTLASSVNDGVLSIDVSSVTGIGVGDLLFFNTPTPVDSTWGYVKRSVARVGQIVGSTIHLSEPLNFNFTTAETTLTARQYASLKMDGINLVQSGGDFRFDFTQLQQCELNNALVQGYAPYLGTVAFFSSCYGISGRDLSILYGVYPVMIAAGSRYGRFTNIFAKDSWHPFDPNTWSYDIRISNMRAVNVQSAIECHPSFEVYYEDVTEHIRSVGGANLVLRCIGGGAIRCTSISTNSALSGAAQGAPLLPAYQYLGQKYDRLYQNVVAPQAELGGQDVRTIYFNDCVCKNFSVDGPSGRVSQVSVNSGTVTSERFSLSRVPVLSPDGPIFLDSPPETFASIDVIKDITGITQANPAVVTAVAHGYSNGDLVWIDGVVGMTELNRRYFTIANVATDTFELSGEDSSGYSAYVSGGKATKGRLAKTYDPNLVAGCGWTPLYEGGMRLRKTGATIAPGTSITIPVKVINGFTNSEEPVRNTSITLRAVSSTDGCASVIYQLYSFFATASVGLLSGAQNALPAIGTLTVAIANFRHHYQTQVSNEGGDTILSGSRGLLYYSFDLVVTADATSDRIQYVDVNFSEVRCGQVV